MTAIRIYLGAMDAMLRGIVASLVEREPDLVVVGHTNDDLHSLDGAHADRAEVLVVQEGRGDAGTLSKLLAPPPLSILAITEDGRRSRTLRLEAIERSLDSADGAGLAGAIRAAAGRA